MVATDPANDGNTVLHVLASTNEADARILLQKVLKMISDTRFRDFLANSLKTTNNTGLTPLLYACSGGYFDNATMLAETGLTLSEAAVCKVDTNGKTALHILAVAPGKVPDKLIGMLMSTALPCAKDNCGRTALYDGIVAGGAGNESVMYALLRHTECVRTLVCGLQQKTSIDDEPSLQKCFTAMASVSSLAALRTLLECVAQDHEGPEEAASIIADFAVEEHFNSLIEASSADCADDAAGAPKTELDDVVIRVSGCDLLIATAYMLRRHAVRPRLF